MRDLPGLVFILLLMSGNSQLFAGELKLMQAEDLPSLGNPAADVRIAYGDDPLQFVNLHLPEGQGPHPVIIFIHGGCWLSDYDISYSGKLAEAFTREGIAVWNIEYRRVGNAGGGWPGTFSDIAQAADQLYEQAEKYSLDSSRVIVSGHSAGGHLALWLAARPQFPADSIFAVKQDSTLKGVLALAPAPDLALLHEQGVCDAVIDKLMGGSPEQRPERYAMASATELVPLSLPQLLVIGKHDKHWRPVGERYYNAAKAAEDNVRIVMAEESGHFEMMDPDSSSWKSVRDAAFELLKFIPR